MTRLLLSESLFFLLETEARSLTMVPWKTQIHNVHHQFMNKLNLLICVRRLSHNISLQR